MGNDVNKRIIILALSVITVLGVCGYHNKTDSELGRVNPTLQLQLKEVVTIFETSSGDIIGCEVLILYDWLVTPGACGEDLISLNWDYGYFTLTDFNSHATVKNISTGKTEYFDFITTPHTAQNGGIDWYTKLRSPDISPKSRPLRNNDNLVKDFDVIYVHDKCPGKTLIDVSDIIYFKMEEDQL